MVRIQVSTYSFYELYKDKSPAEPALLYAIALVESNLDPNAARYEPNWKYPFRVNSFAKNLKITRDTELVFQSTSWGLMQIMGTVAREMGYDDPLTDLTNPHNNMRIACLKLSALYEKWNNLESVVSSYNQGYPKKSNNGKFANQEYVDKVLKQYNLLKETLNLDIR